jgi:hypothetical protein
MPIYTSENTRGRRVEVRLDGVIQRDVTFANTRLGMVMRRAIDANGKPILDGDSFIIETAFGVVEVSVDGDVSGGQGVADPKAIREAIDAELRRLEKLVAEIVAETARRAKG